MWEEIFQYRKKWYNPQSDEEWEVATKEAVEFGKKWQGLGEKLIVAILDYMAEKARESETNGV